MSETSKIVVCLSGGLDSAVALAYVKSTRPDAEFHAVSFRYGSKHNQRELAAAKNVADHYKCVFRLMNLEGAFAHAASDLMAGRGEIPEGHYAAETMRATVVPGRNTVFAATLLGYAESVGACAVVMGVHQGDHFIYPDCRPQWWAAMGEVYRTASEGKVTLACPLLNVDKAWIVQTGIRLKVPFEKTRTCYQEAAVACGKCGSCVERLEAFAQNNAADPIPYQ